MKTQKYHFKLTLLEPMLGTAPLDRGIYSSYFKERSLAAAEKAGVELSPEEIDAQMNDIHDERAGMTGFHRFRDGTPYILCHMVKGYMKESASTLRKVDGSLIAANKALKGFKKYVDGFVFIQEKRIPLRFPEEVDWEYTDEMEFGENGLADSMRSIRASTPMGERIAIGRSEAAPPGTTLEFTMTILGDAIDEDTLREWFDYGEYKGIGQWRSSGVYCTFTYEMQRLA